MCKFSITVSIYELVPELNIVSDIMADVFEFEFQLDFERLHAKCAPKIFQNNRFFEAEIIGRANRE